MSMPWLHGGDHVFGVSWGDLHVICNNTCHPLGESHSMLTDTMFMLKEMVSVLEI